MWSRNLLEQAICQKPLFWKFKKRSWNVIFPHLIDPCRSWGILTVNFIIDWLYQTTLTSTHSKAWCFPDKRCYPKSSEDKFHRRVNVRLNGCLSKGLSATWFSIFGLASATHWQRMFIVPSVSSHLQGQDWGQLSVVVCPWPCCTLHGSRGPCCSPAWDRCSPRRISEREHRPFINVDQDILQYFFMLLMFSYYSSILNCSFQLVTLLYCMNFSNYFVLSQKKCLDCLNLKLH